MADHLSNVKHTHRNTFQVFLWVLKFLFILALVALGAWLVVRQLQQESSLRELMAIVNRLPKEGQLEPIACSSTPMAGGPEKAALQEAVIDLARPTQRATAFCLLGDYPSALAAPEIECDAGDYLFVAGERAK